MSTDTLDEEIFKPEKAEPDELEYGLLVEYAARVGLAENIVQELLADNGMIVEAEGGEIMVISANWDAVRKAHDQILEYGVAQRKTKQGIKPLDRKNWETNPFKMQINGTITKMQEAGFGNREIREAFDAAGLDEFKIEAKNVERFQQIAYKAIETKEMRAFAAQFGVSYPIDNTVGPQGLEWAYAGFKSSSETPPEIEVEGQVYRRLDLIEQELGGNDESYSLDSCDADAAGDDGSCADDVALDVASGDDGSADGCGDDDNSVGAAVDSGVDVLGGLGRAEYQELIEKACFAWRYLAVDANWTERDHRLLHNDVLPQLEIGGISKVDMDELVRLADEHMNPPKVQGEVVEPGTELVRTEAGNLVNLEDGEVLELCERLGFTEAHARNLPAMTQAQAENFVEKIRYLQSSTIDIVNQARRYFVRNMRAIEAGMMFYGAELRRFAEPQLPRYTKDTKTHKAGELKKKSINLLTGDICFRGTGGWTIERKHELDKYCADQLVDLTEQVQALSEEFIAGLPEPLKSIVVIDWKIKADRKKALAAAEAGHQLPGVNYLPKHETDKMMVGINGKPVSLTKPVEDMNAALRAFKSACVATEDDDE